MGELQDTLERLLSQAGSVSHKALPFPKADVAIGSRFGDEIRSVYHRLGGALTRPPINLRSWDIEFNGFAVELDEYLHFNRYRATTLESPAYRELPDFPLEAYRGFCSAHEAHCIKAGGYGGKWSNSSCESQFGPASKPKDLSGNGAPRWKQRAFYDFVKDLSPFVAGVRLSRIAIWDVVSELGDVRTVKDVLSAPSRSSGEALATLLRQRAAT